MKIAVISRNQGDSLKKMIYSLRGQLSSPRLIVLDRCEDNSKDILESMGENFIEKNYGEGWEAGKVRNVAIDKIGNEDIFLFDGDRVPSGLSDELCLEALDKYDITLMSLSEDHRERDMNVEEFADNKWFGKGANLVYTPGILIRGSAIAKIKEFNQGFVFNPVFDGCWGYEDMSMGDVAAHLGMSCGFFPRKVWLRGKFTAPLSREEDMIQSGKRKKLYREIKSIPSEVSKLEWSDSFLNS